MVVVMMMDDDAASQRWMCWPRACCDLRRHSLLLSPASKAPTFLLILCEVCFCCESQPEKPAETPSPAKAGAGGDDDADTKTAQRSGIPVWLVLILAAVMFLIGRLL